MVVLSLLKPSILKPLPAIAKNAVVFRQMSDHGPRLFPLTPSRFQWRKFKDLLHLYFFVGGIPFGLITLGANIFVGPATLREIPDGYVPKEWEYSRHPITRFIARYIMTPIQQDYEKMLHLLFEEHEKMKLRELEAKIMEKMEERRDYKAFYYRPVLAKYHRVSREAADYIHSLRGD